MKGHRDSIAGISWRKMLIVSAVVGFIGGGVVFGFLVMPLSGVVVNGDPLQMDATFRCAPGALIGVVVAGLVTVAASFVLPVSDPRMQVAIAGAGCGIGVISLWLLGTQQVRITPEEFTVRRPGAFWSVSYPLGNGNRVRMEIEHRPFRRHGNRHSIHYDRADGSIEELCHNTRLQPMWTFAAPHLIRGKPVMPKP